MSKEVDVKPVDDRAETILHFWFGHAEQAALPSTHRTWVWFSQDPVNDAEIKEKFLVDIEAAIAEKYKDWEANPRGCLALVIILDQFPRNVFRNTPKAFEQDRQAMDVCLRGIEHQHDHKLSLLERAFFYFPLMHSENLEMQNLSIRAFEMLLGLSFQETRPIFAKFLDYAIRHREIIARFGRFPHRNDTLGRISTDEEREFLKDTGNSF